MTDAADRFDEGTEAERRRAAQKAQVLALLGENKSYPDVAAAVGIGKRTLATWMASDDELRRGVSELRAAKTSELTSRMVGTADDVVEVIRREAFEGERSADRIRAAALYLQLTIRLHHDADVEWRVRRVEEQLGLAPSRRSFDIDAATLDIADNEPGADVGADSADGEDLR